MVVAKYRYRRYISTVTYRDDSKCSRIVTRVILLDDHSPRQRRGHRSQQLLDAMRYILAEAWGVGIASISIYGAALISDLLSKCHMAGRSQPSKRRIVEVEVDCAVDGIKRMKCGVEYGNDFITLL